MKKKKTLKVWFFHFLTKYWPLAKNLSNFVSIFWKLDNPNPYNHNVCRRFQILTLSSPSQYVSSCGWHEYWSLKWKDNPNYYQIKQAEKYQSLIGECGLEIINFGITFNSKKNANVLSSTLDHAITNKPVAVNDYH